MISTHVLDTSLGNPANGVQLTLLKQEDGKWKEIATGTTNSDGRFSFNATLSPGIHQIVFDVETYLKSHTSDYFYHSIPVVFQIKDPQRKYHIPLLLSPFGYSTYRGS